MAGGFTTRVFGGPQLISKFIRMGITAQAGLDVVTGTMAEKVAARAQELVPVVSGDLQRGIRAQKAGFFSWVVSASSREGGAEKEYSRFVEMGTYKMSPRPYLRPALDQVQGELPALLRPLGVKIVTA